VSALSQVKRLGGLTLDFLLPKTCLACGSAGELLCAGCRRSLPRLYPPICPKCGRPQASGVLCASCVRWTSSIDGIRAPFRFGGAIREAVHQFKYRNLRILARPLAELMNDYLDRNPLPAELLVPVPLHPKRMRERGYNQSELLARELGRLISLPLISDQLVRRKYAQPQARTKSVAERQVNMVDAFACEGNAMAGRKVLLIDDVSTSAATLDACAAALKSSGAVSVWGLVLAREV
jgi:ComF family protein